MTWLAVVDKQPKKGLIIRLQWAIEHLPLSQDRLACCVSVFIGFTEDMSWLDSPIAQRFDFLHYIKHVPFLLNNDAFFS